ncbi:MULTISPECIES: metal ABC transporter ATP-binding protein [Psychrobacter]|uniref:Zinc import ATP-binding protein ZnuC n=1 Tax=Psychrobacter alimentarius TaxID=261164 RepID=A0ABM6A1D0_9GAMM|nr:MULTISPECIES: metal ABC transporter ATP-binding protein [Psychrobacter]AMT98157.1 Zinc import ATP-binding protein ZnuC [Psychrobacter alimentarius]QCB29577.1 metal ABC transporter ATP-binding protein [Psychrobacter sp. PAMC27889]
MKTSAFSSNKQSVSPTDTHAIDDKTQLLSLQNVSYYIGQQRLLSDIDIDIAVNETVSLVGPNGAGKSTLVKLILGLIDPTKGGIKAHQPLQLGYVPQRFTVPPILPLRVSDLLGQANKTRLTPEQRQFIFDNLSLTHLLSRQMLHLSGGETQRVLLARALLDKPNLLVLDEPMQGLDPDTEVWLYQFIDQLPDFLRCAMLVVSHDLHWVMRGSRRVICLNKHICCEGQPSELAISTEFQKLFGHYYEQPYVHQPHACTHSAPSELEL